MNFREYQEAALGTAIYPNRGKNFVYPVLGLAGETGEVAEKVKKTIRDHNGCMDSDIKDALKKELGDVLWYVAMICYEVGLDFEDVAESNIRKLKDRQNRGALHGSGDNR